MQKRKNKIFKILTITLIVIILGVVYVSDDSIETTFISEDSNTVSTDKDGKAVEESAIEDTTAGSTSNDTVTIANTQIDQLKLDNIDEINKSARISVHVCGAVKVPGVYQLDEHSRIIDAVDIAGGMLDDAETDYLNLASILNDGMKIYVPFKDEIEKTEFQKALMETVIIPSDSDECGTDRLVNINTADKILLMTLPGIGEAKAGQIINYREQNGAFLKIEDIMSVPGIKEGAFTKIKDLICIK